MLRHIMNPTPHHLTPVIRRGGSWFEIAVEKLEESAEKPQKTWEGTPLKLL